MKFVKRSVEAFNNFALNYGDLGVAFGTGYFAGDAVNNFAQGNYEAGAIGTAISLVSGVLTYKIRKARNEIYVDNTSACDSPSQI